MTTGGGGDTDDWDVVLDESFVKAARTEESAAERTRRAARINQDHSQQAAWRAAGRGDRDLSESPTRRPSRRLRKGLLWLLLLAVAVGTVVTWDDAMPEQESPQASADGLDTSSATATPEAAAADSTPLGAPPPAPRGSGGYRFMRTQDDGSGRPVTFDPCREVHYVVRPDGAPRGGGQILRSAILEVSRATGLVLVDDGTTTEAPSDDRPDRDPARYGDGWSPVLIAWSDEDESPDLAGYITGMAGPISSWDGRPGSERYVSGQVLLDARDFQRILDRPDGRVAARGIVLHELGHLVGLNHVADHKQQMYSEGRDGGAYGKGDLRGLHLLGRGTCFP